MKSLPVPKPRLQRHLMAYLVIGGLTVAVDVGLLALLHESWGVSLGVATTVAYCIAVAVNFHLNRTAMSSSGARGLTQHALRYASLVVANYVITVLVVTTVGHVSARWYLGAKLAVVAASTAWNFLLYRHWIFVPPRPRPAKQDRVPWIGRNSRRRDGWSMERSRRMLMVVPDSEQESTRSPGDQGGRREGVLGRSGEPGEYDTGHEYQV